MKYALFDEQGGLLTRLIKGVNEIPTGAVLVDDDMWLRLTQETDGEWRLGADGIYKAELPPPSTESLVAAAIAQRDVLMREATLRMAPLQDATALGKSTAEEDAALRLLMLYRVDLNRIEQQPDYPGAIAWPALPA
ncbi:tail fiber assembly protein [Pseudomonas sp. 5P_5.1_Bac1]|uniref:tail fiber assembly protein n=1 Tax=Pseudomonas sp. 5P_5.1_Bac1 TaxID=2971616 RepID=UPI0021C87404|nr:tail fiber assembly protein [Pseudomonas sp. 5P_5.1_Bac1]MCU1722436.1 tail fiber assembly protein [Pseudomonas sp. 5P_5.1_Bac1]